MKISSLFALFFLASTASAGTNLCAEAYARLGSADKAGARFLYSQNQNLHNSQMVNKVAGKIFQATGVNLQKPAEKLGAWIEYLQLLQKRAATSPAAMQKIKDLFFEQYVIKPDEVPESFFALQVRLARERGHGTIVLTSEQKKALIQDVITEQQKSLDTWLDYLLSSDTEMYPMWAKYWAITGLTKLSKFNPELGTFLTRSAGTVAPFPEINREALAYVMDAVVKKAGKKSLSEIQDPELAKLLEGANFGKLYALGLRRAGVGGGEFLTNEGKWILYKQGSDPIPLVNSLAGKGSGWCTAGEETARTQLRSGDFYVYYSLDEAGEPMIPRLAIRMEGDKIAEVRGVAKDQNLDPQISESGVLAKKMKEFGLQGAIYEKRARDMEMLTQIERKSKAGAQLSSDDLKFLYEWKEKINGFGYGADPRIAEIIATRDIRDDLVQILEGKYKREEISLTIEDALSGRFKVHYGDIYLRDKQLANITLPETMKGNLWLGELESAKGLKLPETLNGSLNLSSFESAKGLQLPKTLNGSLSLESLESAEGLQLPETLNGNLDLFSLLSAKGLQLPKTINGRLNLGNLQSAEGLKLPETLNGSLNLESLKSAEGLQLPETHNGALYLRPSGP